MELRYYYLWLQLFVRKMFLILFLYTGKCRFFFWTIYNLFITWDDIWPFVLYYIFDHFTEISWELWIFKKCYLHPDKEFNIHYPKKKNKIVLFKMIFTGGSTNLKFFRWYRGAYLRYSRYCHIYIRWISKQFHWSLREFIIYKINSHKN